MCNFIGISDAQRCIVGLVAPNQLASSGSFPCVRVTGELTNTLSLHGVSVHVWRCIVRMPEVMKLLKNFLVLPVIWMQAHWSWGAMIVIVQKIYYSM